MSKAGAEELSDAISKLDEGLIRTALSNTFGVGTGKASPGASAGDASAKMSDPPNGFIESLKAADSSQVLDLAHIELGKAGVKVLAPILRSRASRSFAALRCNNANLSDFGSSMDPVREFCHALQGHTSITHLDLRGNMMTRTAGSSVAALVAELPLLRHLDLSCNRLRSEGAAAVAEAIDAEEWQEAENEDVRRKGVPLFSLNLSENNMSNFHAAPRGAMALAGALQSHPTLRHLDLSRNRLGATATAALATALRTNTSLTSLRLDDNGIGPAETEQLAGALRGNNTLVALCMRENQALTDGAVAMADAMSAPDSVCALSWLDLRGNAVAYHGRVRLAAACVPLSQQVRGALLRAAVEEKAAVAKVQGYHLDGGQDEAGSTPSGAPAAAAGQVAVPARGDEAGSDSSEEDEEDARPVRRPSRTPAAADAGGNDAGTGEVKGPGTDGGKGAAATAAGSATEPSMGASHEVAVPRKHRVVKLSRGNPLLGNNKGSSGSRSRAQQNWSDTDSDEEEEAERERETKRRERLRAAGVLREQGPELGGEDEEGKEEQDASASGPASGAGSSNPDPAGMMAAAAAAAAPASVPASESGAGPGTAPAAASFGVPPQARDDPPAVKAERAMVVDWAAEEIVLRSPVTGVTVLVG